MSTATQKGRLLFTLDWAETIKHYLEQLPREEGDEIVGRIMREYAMTTWEVRDKAIVVALRNAVKAATPKLTFKSVRAELKKVGIVLRRCSLSNEYSVHVRGEKPESAYFTPDLDDALASGKAIAVDAETDLPDGRGLLVIMLEGEEIDYNGGANPPGEMTREQWKAAIDEARKLINRITK